MEILAATSARKQETSVILNFDCCRWVNEWAQQVQLQHASSAPISIPDPSKPADLVNFGELSRTQECYLSYPDGIGNHAVFECNGEYSPQ